MLAVHFLLVLSALGAFQEEFGGAMVLNLPSINRGSRELADYSLFSLKKAQLN